MIPEITQANGNIAPIAGSTLFLLLIARIIRCIFVNLVYYAVMATFGAVLATANTINREHDRWLEYRQTLNDPEQSEIPNLPGNHATADADQPAGQADNSHSPSTEPQPATT